MFFAGVNDLNKIAILTDSGCQIGYNEFEQYGVYVAPLQITIDNKNYFDQIDLSTQQIFEMMKDSKVNVSTSQPSTGSLIEILTKIKDAGYTHVLAISMATGLSSTLNGMKVAADMINMPITLVDSKSTAGNQRYLVKVAMTLIQEGKSILEIVEILESLIEDSATFIMVTSFEQLKKSGRITPAVALLCGMLKIVPILKLSHDLGGKIDGYSKVRTIKKAGDVVVNYFKEKNIDDQHYVLTFEHVANDELGNKMLEHLKEELQVDKVSYGLLPSTVGVHMGIGGMGYQYIRKYNNIEP